MKIELNDHVGESITGALVDHNQWVVMCDDVHVGYLQKTEGAWLQCIVFMDEPTKVELIAAVSKAADLKVNGAAVPVNPAYLPQDDNEGEDDSE